jgi:hypothetical protein
MAPKGARDAVFFLVLFYIILKSVYNFLCMTYVTTPWVLVAYFSLRTAAVPQKRDEDMLSDVRFFKLYIYILNLIYFMCFKTTTSHLQM